MPKMKVRNVQRNDEIGQMEAVMIVTNDAILFLRQAVDAFIQSNLGDPDDPKFNAIKVEVKQDLHEAWKLLNPS